MRWHTTDFLYEAYFILHLALQEDIVKAMGLTGQLLMGQAVMVKSAEVGSVYKFLIEPLNG